MSGFIFVLIMDWVMRHTNNRRRGLRWKLTSVLEDLDYAYDVALISSRFADLQEKTDRLVATAGIVGTSPNNISRTALTWAPEGKRRRGRPRETLRRTAEKERNQLGWHSWGLAAASAADRDGLRDLLAGLKSPHGLDED